MTRNIRVARRINRHGRPMISTCSAKLSGPYVRPRRVQLDNIRIGVSGGCQVCCANTRIKIRSPRKMTRNIRVARRINRHGRPMISTCSAKLSGPYVRPRRVQLDNIRIGVSGGCQVCCADTRIKIRSAREITRNIRVARRINRHGTPTIIINSTELSHSGIQIVGRPRLTFPSGGDDKN